MNISLCSSIRFSKLSSRFSLLLDTPLVARCSGELAVGEVLADLSGDARPDDVNGVDLAAELRLFGRVEFLLLALEPTFSGVPFLEEVVETACDEATELFLVELVDTFLEEVCDVDIFNEVVNDADLVSRLELSLRNSFAELSDLGGDVDRVEALDDFLLDADTTDELEVFLVDELDDFLADEVWPILTNPRLIASSNAICLPVSGFVYMPDDSSIQPRFKAS